jgi:hypothetical protein
VLSNPASHLSSIRLRTVWGVWYDMATVFWSLGSRQGRYSCQCKCIGLLRPQITDFVARLLCISGHLCECFLEFIVSASCCGSHEGFVPFVRQGLYPHLQLVLIALWAMELFCVVVGNLKLKVDDLLWVIAHHMHLPDWLCLLAYTQ